jgi:hypothetical protein
LCPRPGRAHVCLRVPGGRTQKIGIERCIRGVRRRDFDGPGREMDHNTRLGQAEGLTLRGVVRAAMGTYARHFLRVTFVAVLLTGSLGVADAALARAIDLEDGAGWWPTVLFGLYSLMTVTGVLALEFYAGLLDRIVSEDQYGHSSHTIRQVLRTLPYGRLVLASALLTTVYLVGTILLVIPGIVALTLFSLTGPSWCSLTSGRSSSW